MLPPGFLDIAELEHHARYMRSLQPVTMPGLLQTPEYARALFSAALPRLPEDEVEARVEHRMRRATVLDRDEPPEFASIVHEAALRMRPGGRKVARAQLEYLLEAVDRPNVSLRVIPFASELYVDMAHTALYAGGVVPQLDTVHIDAPIRSVYLDAEAELHRCRLLLELGQTASLDPAESRSFIHHLARDM